MFSRANPRTELPATQQTTVLVFREAFWIMAVTQHTNDAPTNFPGWQQRKIRNLTFLVGPLTSILMPSVSSEPSVFKVFGEHPTRANLWIIPDDKKLLIHLKIMNTNDKLKTNPQLHLVVRKKAFGFAEPLLLCPSILLSFCSKLF